MFLTLSLCAVIYLTGKLSSALFACWRTVQPQPVPMMVDLYIYLCLLCDKSGWNFSVHRPAGNYPGYNILIFGKKYIVFFCSIFFLFFVNMGPYNVWEHIFQSAAASANCSRYFFPTQTSAEFSSEWSRQMCAWDIWHFDHLNLTNLSSFLNMGT